MRILPCTSAIKSTLERKGVRIEDFDAAAVLVTANSRHMLRVPGVEVEDWSAELEETQR